MSSWPLEDFYYHLIYLFLLHLAIREPVWPTVLFPHSLFSLLVLSPSSPPPWPLPINVREVTLCLFWLGDMEYFRWGFTLCWECFSRSQEPMLNHRLRRFLSSIFSSLGPTRSSCNPLFHSKANDCHTEVPTAYYLQTWQSKRNMIFSQSWALLSLS